MLWRDFDECAGWHLDVVQVASEAQDGVSFLSGRARGAGGSVPREGRGSECGCHLALQGGAECGHPGAPGCMEDIVKVVGRLRLFERV